ncbi:hypothetical protein Salat_2803100 [Sesamum alatum]|uniref:Uncharacterized protein n=1 Tax=Sesamum alatum TaxID=300844 RepID=A0AAE1XL71_9LAMI|nr:hypothetical protein Salat_2803100 [Sesamum alatum]
MVQHSTGFDPTRAAKKTFKEDEGTAFGQTFSFKGEPAIPSAKDKGKKVMFSDEECVLPIGAHVTQTAAEQNQHNLEVSNSLQAYDTTTHKQVNHTQEAHDSQLQTNNQAQKEDFNFEDPVLVALLDKDWDTEIEGHQGSMSTFLNAQVNPYPREEGTSRKEKRTRSIQTERGPWPNQQLQDEE